MTDSEPIERFFRDLVEPIIARLDRIERRVERMNITPAELDLLEKTRATLEGADATIDAIASTSK